MRSDENITSNDNTGNGSPSADTDDDTFFAYYSPFRPTTGSRLHLNEEENLRTKKQLDSDLRIGSAMFIGEKHLKSSFFNNETSSFKNQILSQTFSPTKHKSETKNCRTNKFSTTIVNKMFLAPIDLLRARELGFQLPRGYFLHKFWVEQPIQSGVTNYRIRWPTRQTFKEHIKGNIWSVNALGLQATFKYHTGCVNAINFSSSGRCVASASDDHHVAIVDIDEHKLKTKFHSGHNLNVFQVKFVPESSDLQLVTSGRDSMVRLTTLHPSGKSTVTTRCLAKHDGACHKIAFVSDEPTVFLSAGEDGCVFSIDLRSSKPLTILSLPLSSFYSVSTNPMRPFEFCVCGKAESVVRVFDRRKLLSRDIQGGFLHSFAPPHLTSPKMSGKIHPIKWSSNQIDDEELEMESDVESIHDATESLSFQLSHRIRRILGDELSDSERSTSSIRRLRHPQRISSHFDPLNDHVPTKYNITAAVYSAQGDAILASFNDEDIYLFDSRDDRLPPMHSYRGHRNMDTVKGVNFFGPNSEFIVSGSDDGFLYIWDRYSEGIVQWLCADINGSVNVIESHPFCPTLATSGVDYDFKIWSPKPIQPDIKTPEAWLLSSKHNDLDQETVDFDPVLVVRSMNRLRKSQLAKCLFGDSFQFDLTKNSPNKTENLSTQLPSQSDHTRNNVRNLQAVSSTKSKDKIASLLSPSPSPAKKRRVVPGSPTETNNVCRKRCSKPQASPKKIKDSIDSMPRVVQAPCKTLPFNIYDLQLRVAMNWIERSREANTFSFLGHSERRFLSTLASLTSARIRYNDTDASGRENRDEHELHLSWDDVVDQTDSPDESLPPSTGGCVCLVIRRSSQVPSLTNSLEEGLSETLPLNDMNYVSSLTSCSSSSSASSTSPSSLSSSSNHSNSTISLSPLPNEQDDISNHE